MAWQRFRQGHPHENCHRWRLGIPRQPAGRDVRRRRARRPRADALAPIWRNAARPGHRRPWHHAGRLERRRRQRTMGDRRRSRRRGHQSLGRVAGFETLVGRGEEAVAGEPTPRDAEPRDGDRRRRVAAGGSGERQRRWILRTGRFQSDHGDRSGRQRFPRRALRRIGNAKPSRPSARAHASFCSGPASSSNDREARCWK